MLKLILKLEELSAQIPNMVHVYHYMTSANYLLTENYFCIFLDSTFQNHLCPAVLFISASQFSQERKKGTLHLLKKIEEDFTSRYRNV